jgi:peptide/nickel transport system ATP-binding protein
MSAVLAEFRHLSVGYRTGGAPIRGLDDVSLGVFAGERLAVIGESGSGKSTLALALAGLLPDAAIVTGRIGWPGLGREPGAGRDIGFVFQDAGASLNPVLPVGEQIAEAARQHLGLSWKDAHDRAGALLGRVRIEEPVAALAAYPHQLSGGQRQRVAIAAAIAARPLLLIADEPTSALDTIAQADVIALLETLVAEDGMTLLLITHDIALASGFADRIAVIRGGRLVELAPARRIVERPEAPYTRQLLASHIGLDTPPLIAEPQ